MLKKLFPVIVLFISESFTHHALAEVVINGTRIVFNAKDTESVIQLKNNGKNPYLLQLWIDNGDPKARPSESNVPFVITPPIIRIDPNKGQAVRILMPSTSLPQNKETLFWFNMLEIPPKPTTITNGENHLQLAFRTRIKLFYRPPNLTPEPFSAYKKLQFSLEPNKLSISNTSPYYITFKKIEIRKSKNSPVLASVDKFTQRMVEPYGKIELPIKIKEPKQIKDSTLLFSVINDYGGETENEYALQ